MNVETAPSRIPTGSKPRRIRIETMPPTKADRVREATTPSSLGTPGISAAILPVTSPRGSMLVIAASRSERLKA
jgi:hypothetical protein